MSRCYGWLMSDTGKQITKTGHSHIRAKLQTWSGDIIVTLNDNNTVEIESHNIQIEKFGLSMKSYDDGKCKSMEEAFAELHRLFRIEMPKGARYPSRQVEELRKLIDAGKLAKQLEGQQ
jgi:hypothetical protein